MLGVQLFTFVQHGEFLDDQRNFDTFGAACLVLAMALLIVILVDHRTYFQLDTLMRSTFYSTLNANGFTELSQDPLIIGKNMDDDILVMNPSTGELFCGDEALGDLSQYLGRFRFELCGNRIEWAEGWVAKG